MRCQTSPWNGLRQNREVDRGFLSVRSYRRTLPSALPLASSRPSALRTTPRLSLSPSRDRRAPGPLAVRSHRRRSHGRPPLRVSSRNLTSPFASQRPSSLMAREPPDHWYSPKREAPAAEPPAPRP